MAKKSRKVELYKLIFKAHDESNSKTDFYSFIKTYIDKSEDDSDPYKNIYFEIIDDTLDYFVLGITTTKMYGIPPKNDIKKHKSGAILLTPDEGIGYSNVILYDKNYRVLYYEFNQNGLWISTFVDYILSIQKTKNCPLEIQMIATPIIRKEAYQRLIEFGRYNQIELQIANPDGLILKEKSQKASLDHIIESNQGIGAEVLSYFFKVDSRKSDSSLNIPTVRRILEQAKNILSGEFSSHIRKFKVTGFHGDGDGLHYKKESIDLVNDRFSRKFDINEPRIRQDLQFHEKKVGIVKVYKRCLPEIREIFKK